MIKSLPLMILLPLLAGCGIIEKDYLDDFDSFNEKVLLEAEGLCESGLCPNLCLFIDELFEKSI